MYAIKLHSSLAARYADMSSLALDLDRALSQLDPETVALLERAVRDALALAERRAKAVSGSPDALGYPAGYFESTAGSFAGEPLESPAELPMSAREPW